MSWWSLACVPGSEQFPVLSSESLLFSYSFRTSLKLILSWQVWEEELFPVGCLEVLFIVTSVDKLSNSRHTELQYEGKSDLNWKWGRCSSSRSKTILLRWKFLERLANFFRLVLVWSFSILYRWFLTLTYQLISTSTSTIISQK